MATTSVGKALASTTYNIDVHSIVRRYNRILMEILKSQSSGISQTMPFDVTRVTSYVGAMNNFIDFVVGQPLLDCPETGPTEIALPANPAIPYIENESGYDLMQLIQIARDEIANSQSSRIPTNLVSFDYDRQKSYLQKITNLLAYIAGSEPLDLPESSPMVVMSGSGNQGV
jgi:hypothetical protein